MKDNDDGEVEEIVGDGNDNARIEPVVDDADDANIDDPMPAELPKKQKFKNLDEVLDEDNYVDLPTQRKRTFKYADAKNALKINWETIPSQQSLQPRGAVNILKHKPGPRGTAKQVQTPLQSFNLFFADEMLEKVMMYTNSSIEPAMERFSDLLKENDKYPHFWRVDKIDISAFIGLLYLLAVFRLNLRETLEIWNHENSHEIFCVTMSYNRFQFIRKFVTFDDKSTRDNRWKMDKFACLRDLFELMNERNVKCRFPSPLLAVDETLYPYRGAIGFKQYNPKKPAKYGLLYCSLCDSSVS